MKNWKQFWQNYRIIDINSDIDLLYQTGKTVNKKPIDSSTFTLIIDGIIKNLNLHSNDTLLDLCCGNGTITYELSKTSNQVFGIDFSVPFINNAITYKKNQNIEYICHDITKLSKMMNNLQGASINKVLLYDGLAYFNKTQLKALIKTLSDITKGNVTMLFGSVLDSKKKWNFFNTFNRKINYFINIKLLKNSKGLGAWWRMDDIKEICEALEFFCAFIDQPSQLYTSHYRTDVVIRGNGKNI